MQIPKDLHRSITTRYGTLLDLKANPEILQEIFAEVWGRVMTEAAAPQGANPASPFGISWMDSWVAHWVVNEKIQTAEARNAEFAAVLKGLVELKFNERIAEIRRFIRDFGVIDAPPDGGTPEPGVPPPPPPVGPAPGPAIFVPPDGGPPEPGTPAGPGPSIFEPPDGGPPEPGTPPVGPSIFEPPDAGPPEPGVPPDPSPPAGPDAGFMRDNPWILYWFVSVRAPQILDMIDAHFTRRMNDVRGQAASD